MSIDLKALNELVKKLNECVPKETSENFREEIQKWVEPIGLLTLISNESIYLLGDIANICKPKEQVEVKNDVVKKVYDKNSN